MFASLELYSLYLIIMGKITKVVFKEFLNYFCLKFLSFYRKKFSILLHFISVALNSLIKLVCNLVEFMYWQITYTITAPEVAFTGDTMSDFILDKANIDVLRARILVVEVHYWDSFIFATSELEILVCFVLLNF